mgnify:CR=1 FL=1
MSSVMDDILQEVAKETKIETCIKVCLKVGASDEQIIELLKEDNDISETEAKEQLSKFKANAASQQ